MRVRLPSSWWLMLPTGWDEVGVEGGMVKWRTHRYVCRNCCSDEEVVELPLPALGGDDRWEVVREPCSAGRAGKAIFYSFLLAFMFHLIVSVAFGVERSLGSPENHRLMGGVWFLGW